MAKTKENVTDTENGKTLKVPCEVYSRIVGYLRPVQNWNDGKRAEFADRRMFNVDNTT